MRSRSAAGTPTPSSATSAGIVSIPTEYFDTARLEGGAWVRFRHVIVPLSRNATFTVILLSFVSGLRTFDLIWTMTNGGPANYGSSFLPAIYQGTRIGAPGKLFEVAGGNSLYFVGQSDAAGGELWRSDGTPEGTYVLKDITLGGGSTFGQHNEFVAADCQS